MSTYKEERVLERVAVIGMAGRFPGAPDLGRFWANLCQGVESIRYFSVEELAEAGVDRSLLEDPGYVRAVGYLEGIDQFDAEFFGYSRREAELIDPQQRLFLECAWDALENANCLVEGMEGSIGIYAGAGPIQYLHRNLGGYSEDTADLFTWMISNEKDYLAARAAYKLNLRGPALTVQTACSTSLVALHLACQGLLNYECDAALAGGVNLLLPAKRGYLYQKGMVLSPDGHCRAFDAEADGFVPGSGVAVVVLKRLSDALNDGDEIDAVVLGSAINHDGAAKVGFTAPGVSGQAEAVSTALALAGVPPETITYIETHGTATALGDPVEIAALTQAFRRQTSEVSFCAIGSVKTNIGHLADAAGIAGFVKTVLSLKHRQIPPSLFFEKPNPHIDFAASPFFVNASLSDWKSGRTPRRAGVSSIGLGGTNAHVILEEPPHRDSVSDDRTQDESPLLLPLSARSLKALEATAAVWHRFLAGTEGSSLNLSAICGTASLCRSHHEHRIAVAGSSHEELAAHLKAIASGESAAPEAPQSLASSKASSISSIPPSLPSDGGEGRGEEVRPYRSPLSSVLSPLVPRKERMRSLMQPWAPIRRRQVAFVFPGQGGQWLGMGRHLLREPVFRAAIEDCDRALREFADWSIVEELQAPQGKSQFHRIDVVQPVLFGFQIGLAALWRSRGIEPGAVVGHSMGEVAAAHVGGALNLRDAVKIIGRRSQLLRRISGQGGMILVELGVKEAGKAIHEFKDRLSVAASNSPSTTVISGEPEALEKFVGQLEAQGIPVFRIKVDVASHSSQVDPLRAELLDRLNGIAPAAGSIPIYSTVTGQTSDGHEFDATYWIENLRRPVLFSHTIEQLQADGFDAFVELSPHPVLGASVEDCLRCAQRTGLVLPSMRRDEDERRVLLESLAQLFTAGCEVNWSSLYSTKTGRVRLPAYTWQRQRYWIDPPRKTTTASREKNSDSAVQARLSRTLIEPCVLESGAAAFQPPKDWTARKPSFRSMANQTEENGSASEATRARVGEGQPQSETERRLAVIWTEVLGVPQPGIQENFFSTGGHSLLAVRLLTRVQKEFGTKVSFTSFILAPTISGLANRLDKPGLDSDWSPLVPIQPFGTRPPFFCVTPIMGTAFPYYELAAKLGNDQPFFALQPLGLNPGDKPLSRMEAIAEYFANAVLAVQQTGPIHLGGWSFGAPVAFEMARVLREKGHAIGLVALIDTAAPVPSQRPTLARGLRYFCGEVLPELAPYVKEFYRIVNAPTDSPMPTKADHGRKSFLSRQKDFFSASLPLVRVSLANFAAGFRYRPKAYSGPVVLLKTGSHVSGQQPEPAWGWREITRHTDVIQIPGSHMTLLRPPHVDELAKALKARLSQVPYQTRDQAKQADSQHPGEAQPQSNHQPPEHK